ncbi:hypothetical protein TSPI_07987 [Trichinella spiralis]
MYYQPQQPNPQQFCQIPVNRPNQYPPSQQVPQQFGYHQNSAADLPPPGGYVQQPPPPPRPSFVQPMTPQPYELQQPMMQRPPEGIPMGPYTNSPYQAYGPPPPAGHGQMMYAPEGTEM